MASFLSRNYEILTIDKIRKSKFVNRKINHKVVDLKNKSRIDKIFKIFNPNIVIHLAGQSTIDMVKKKKLYYDNNYLATKNLIEVVKKFKTPNLIFSSTAAVYKKRNFRIEEISKLHSSNSYGNSKIKCENIIRKLNTKTTKFCILRFFNVSSSYVEDKVGEYHNPETHLIPLIINSIYKKKKIFIYGNNYKTKDGTCFRDYIHILDILYGIKKSIQYLKKKHTKSEIFNLGSGKCFSVYQIIKTCFKISKLETEILIKNKRRHDVDYLQCDINKARKILKWKPKFSNLKKIIKDEIWWYKYLKYKNLKRKYYY